MKKILVFASAVGIASACFADAACDAYKKEILKDDSLVHLTIND